MAAYTHCNTQLWLSTTSLPFIVPGHCGEVYNYCLFYSAPSFPAALLMGKVHLRSPWRNLPGDCSTRKALKRHYCNSGTAPIMESKVEFNWLKYHCFSVSEHTTRMEALHKFYFIHNYPLKNKLNFFFCEINTLISCIVTANSKHGHGKMHTKYEKVHVFLSLLKWKIILSQSKWLCSGFCTIPGKNDIQTPEDFSPTSKTKENSVLYLTSSA